MKNKILLIVILLLSLTSSVVAQSKYVISGYVRDKLSAEPLVGIMVSGSAINGIYTNDYGFYSLTVTKGDVLLTFSGLAYNTAEHKITVNSDIELDVNLTTSELVIEDVTVTNEQNSMVATRTLGAYSVNSSELKYVPSFMGERDIFKFFQLLPGVNSGKEASSGMNLRGGSTDQTLILMDNIPIYNSAHAFGFISIFSGDYIKSAELYKGHIPAEYGGRLSGVATMNIREGNRKEHQQSLQLGTMTISGLAEGPINGGKGSYLVGGRWFIPNILLSGYSLIASKTSSQYPLPNFYDATAKVSYDITNNSTLYGSFYTGQDAFSFVSHDNYGDGVIAHSKSGFNWGNIAGSIRLSSKLSNKSFLDATAYYSHLANNRINRYDDTNNKILNSDIDSKLDEYGLKLDVKHNLNDWYNLNYGANLSYQHFVPQDVTINRDGVVINSEYGTRSLFTTAIYMDNQLRFNNFRMNAGGRVAWYNNNNENKVVVEPRLALTYYMDKSSMWVSYTGNSQPLFSLNLHTSSIPLEYWIPFQEADELPTSEQISLGYKHTIKSLTLQAESYYKKSNNLSIVQNIDDFLLEDGGYTIGEGEAWGFELLALYRLKRLNIMGSYTYSKSVHHIDGETVDFIFDTPHNLNIFASYEVMKRGARKHTLSANINYKTGLPYIVSNTGYPMQSPPSEWDSNLIDYPIYANSRLVNFFRVDLNYTMEKKLKRGSRVWQISLLNATAHRNPYVVYVDYDDIYNSETQTTTYTSSMKALQLIPILPSISYIRKF